MKNVNDLPEWAESEEEWEKAKKETAESAIEYGWNPKKHKPYTECAKCGKKIILTLCKYRYVNYYCPEHCPNHRWQSDYDWSTECAKCGISYTHYLENILLLHKIPFKK